MCGRMDPRTEARGEEARVGACDRAPAGMVSSMKKVLELILCILHPIAVVLIWIRLLGRSDLGLIGRLAWALAVIVPFVPFLYVLSGNDIL
jgi:hypothetical protein